MMSGIWTMISGIWTVMSGTRTVISRIWTVMSGIWTENVSDVWNMASFHWPYSGHQLSMSGRWPVFTGHLPDNDFSIRLMSGIGTVMSRLRTMMSGI